MNKLEFIPAFCTIAIPHLKNMYHATISLQVAQIRYYFLCVLLTYRLIQIVVLYHFQAHKNSFKSFNLQSSLCRLNMHHICYYIARFTLKWLKQQNSETFKGICGTNYLTILSYISLYDSSYQYVMHRYVYTLV